MPTPQDQELTDLNDGPSYLTQSFQQTNTHNPNTYPECRLSPPDYPLQRSAGDHQIIDQQNDTVQNEVSFPPNNTSTPFQSKNHNSMLTQQLSQFVPNDVVIQHLQQQALNQTQLNDILGSILSSQQNIQ